MADNPAMALTDYTTYDEVRAVLSLSDTELEDTALALPLFETLLLEHLRGVAVDLSDKYLTLKATATTPQELRFVRLTAAFSTYAVANLMRQSLGLLAVKSENDARAGYERFANPLDDTVQMIASYYATARANLIDAYNDLFDPDIIKPTGTFTIAGAASLGTNPITS